jgi:hypothetical protein
MFSLLNALCILYPPRSLTIIYSNQIYKHKAPTPAMMANNIALIERDALIDEALLPRAPSPLAADDVDEVVDSTTTEVDVAVVDGTEVTTVLPAVVVDASVVDAVEIMVETAEVVLTPAAEVVTTAAVVPAREASVPVGVGNGPFIRLPVRPSASV